ncbi:hypothetical protein KJN74_04055 [Candidatus Bathyarchaeota archaeon]|nr:hypothetical protein [Candidatus Bathyarchaeota archaeon]
MLFIADSMFGKLTRWLRILGHDVKYYKSMDDNELLEKAKSETRVVLTRDLGLFRKAIKDGVKIVLVESETITRRLVELSRRFDLSLKMDLRISRCPKCNDSIISVSKEQMIEQIPKATSKYCNEFWKCIKCGQIYWRGSHWKKINKTLNEAKELLNLN